MEVLELAWCGGFLIVTVLVREILGWQTTQDPGATARLWKFHQCSFSTWEWSTNKLNRDVCNDLVVVSRSQAADLVELGLPDLPIADCASSSGWCLCVMAWRKNCTVPAESCSWNITQKKILIKHMQDKLDTNAWGTSNNHQPRSSYLSLICHLKTVFGPQSGCWRKKLASLKGGIWW